MTDDRIITHMRVREAFNLDFSFDDFEDAFYFVNNLDESTLTASEREYVTNVIYDIVDKIDFGKWKAKLISHINEEIRSRMSVPRSIKEDNS